VTKPSTPDPTHGKTEGLAVHQLKLGPWDNLIYFIIDVATRKCAVVDPAWHAPTILVEAKRLDLEISHILCTHSHFDHVNRVETLLESCDVPVHMLREEIEFSGYHCENLVASRPGDDLRIGKGVEVTMMHTPGHTPGSACYRVADGVVAGDTLFVDGCGRCDFVGGDPRQMYETLQAMLEKLPPDARLYPGHDYGERPVDTLSGQRDTNPFLQFDSVQGFVAHRMKGKTAGSPLPTPPDWSPAT